MIRLPYMPQSELEKLVELQSFQQAVSKLYCSGCQGGDIGTTQDPIAGVCAHACISGGAAMKTGEDKIEGTKIRVKMKMKVFPQELSQKSVA